MPNSTTSFSLAILPFSLLLAYGNAACAQEKVNDEADKAKPAQAKPAKPATPANLASEKPQKVEISGVKGYDERRQDTASKIVVTQEDIVRYGDTNIGDVLKRLPGVTIGGVQGRGGNIRMRGLGAGYTQVMLNGEPSPPGFSLDSISPDNIERIEVIRSATAELSTQSIAGAINIVLKRAIVTAQREIKVGLQDDGGQVGGNASLQISDKLGRMSYSVSANVNQGKYERFSASDEIGSDLNNQPTVDQHIDAKDWGTFTGGGVSPRVNWNLANGDTLTSQSFFNMHRFSGFNQSTTTSAPAPLRQPLYASDFSDVVSDAVMVRSNLNWTRKLADSAKLDVRMGISYNKRSSDVAYLGFGPNQEQLLSRKVNASSSDKGLTFGGKYTAPFITDHAIAAGWDGAINKRNETRMQADNAALPILPINLDEVFNAEVSRLALFMQDEWNVSKNWSIYGGLRWEGLDTNSKGNTYEEVNNKSSVWSPILQTLWKIPGSKNDQVRLGLTRTYKAPDTGSLIPRRFISNNNSETSPDRTGNPDLKPELAWGLDAAFEHYLNDGGVLSASVFMRRIDDITRTGLSNASGRWVAMPINDGVATTRGIELDAKFPLRSVMADAPAIDFRSNLSFNWSDLSTVPGPNNRLDSQTPISANLGLDYKLDTMPLTLGGNYSFQNGGPVRISAEQSSYSIPKRVVDVYALWKFDAKANLRISVGNALRQDNISASTYAGLNGTTTRTTTTPTTMTVRAMLEYKI